MDRETKALRIRSRIIGICQKHQYFTCGSSRQYERMLDFVEKNFDKPGVIGQVAWIIGFCSRDETDLQVVVSELKKAFEVTE